MSFTSRDDLSKRLQDLNQDYEKYGTKLWQNGFRSFYDFTWAADNFYMAAEVEKAHIQSIRVWAVRDDRPVSSATVKAALEDLRQTLEQDAARIFRANDGGPKPR